MSVMESRDVEPRIFETVIEHGARKKREARGNKQGEKFFHGDFFCFVCFSFFWSVFEIS